MKKKTKKDKIIHLPHIHYRVILRQKTYPGRGGPCCEKVDNAHCILWIDPEYLTSGTVVHEAMHALQFIAEAREIDLTSEQEHAAYIIQYIFTEALGIKMDVI